MKCRTLLCAQTIIVDLQTKRLSAINILENSIINSFPTALPLMVCTLLEKDDGDDATCEAFLEIKLNDIEIAKNRINVNFAGTTLAKSIINIGVLPIASAGELKISIFCRETEIISQLIKLSPIQQVQPA
jgi:hypothetical protein